MQSRYPGTEPPNRAPSEHGAGGHPAGGRPLGDLGARVAVAIPAAAITVLLVLQGGLLLALVLALLGAAAVTEAYGLMREAAPVRAAGVGAVALLPLAALYGGLPAAMLLFLASVPVAFALVDRDRPGAPAAIAATVLGVAWIGLALAHGVLLRELPDGGRLAIGVLLGTFIGDTAAHLMGSALGRTRIAPVLSPRKTLEGLLAGIVVGTAALWTFMTLSDAALRGLDALALGLVVAVAAPLGDLFQSLFKREAGVKDAGRVLGAHGGFLDRIDAVLFTVIASYYVARALL